MSNRKRKNYQTNDHIYIYAWFAINGVFFSFFSCLLLSPLASMGIWMFLISSFSLFPIDAKQDGWIDGVGLAIE